MGIEADIGIWITVFVTLFVFSFLYRDSPMYRLVEHTYVGAAAGHWVLMGLSSINSRAFTPLVTKFDLIQIIPILLGLALFTLYSKKYYWANRYGTALMAGAGIGLSVGGAVAAQILAQIRATFLPILGIPPLEAFNNIIIILATLTGIFFFIFTIEQKGTLGKISLVGRIFLMIGFGAGFGSTILYRYAITIAAVNYLIMPAAINKAVIATIITIAALGYLWYSEKKSA